MSRLFPISLAVILLTACGGAINPPVVGPPPSVQPPQGDVLPPSGSERPIVTQPPGSGEISPPGSSPTPGTGGEANPYVSLPGDAALQRGEVYVDSIQLVQPAIYPVRILLNIKGNLPDPCHHLRVVVQPPDAKKRIDVELYSVADPGQACIQVLEPFDTSINLGSFPSGHYTVWVNGGKVGEFDA